MYIYIHAPNTQWFLESRNKTLHEAVYVFRRIYREAPAVLLLVLWAWCLLKADDATLNVVIPFMLGSFDWIHYFFR